MSGGSPATDRILYCPDIPWDELYVVIQWNKKPYRNERILSNIVALDTETAKYTDEILFVTDWTLTIENFGCIYGNRVEDMIDCLGHICEMLETSENNKMLVYVHNFAYDYMYLRNHLFEAFGDPVNSLATKPHKYITMRFQNGIEFRDSYILCGRSLEKFTADMNTSIQKQSGTWDYDKFRTPGSGRTETEIYYVCADTISLVLALREFMRQHKCNTATVEYTNTGFVRSEGLRASKTDKSWRSQFLKCRLEYDEYMLLDNAFHGGYTHANRYHIGEVMHDLTGYDFTSSYPARMLYNKFPMGKWVRFTGANVYDIIDMADTFAFMGYLLLSDVSVHIDCPMPPISKHKCKVLQNAIIDNGRVVKADLLAVPFTDPDLIEILNHYDYDIAEIQHVMYTEKEYLPGWFCEMIMKLFENKTTQKGRDPVLYMLSKGMLNSLYGMSVQKIIRDEITENFGSGEWLVDRVKSDMEKANEQLEKFYKNRKKYLPYQWGVWVTAYAQSELFKLGRLCEDWIYSDTDSVKGAGWDLSGLASYNSEILQTARNRGYGTLNYNGKQYTIGTAEFDGNYEEFVTLGSKRYCYRENGELHITVAGVPKIGVDELQNDIRKFRRNMIFKNTHKQASTYINHDGIQTITIGNETIEYGCAVRLDPVEYTLDQTLQYNPETGLPYEEFL